MLSNFRVVHTYNDYKLLTQWGAAHLHDAFNILLDGIDNVSLAIPNFTQIQHSCEKLQQWQYGRTFQVILKEVGICN